VIDLALWCGNESANYQAATNERAWRQTCNVEGYRISQRYKPQACDEAAQIEIFS